MIAEEGEDESQFKPGESLVYRVSTQSTLRNFLTMCICSFRLFRNYLTRPELQRRHGLSWKSMQCKKTSINRNGSQSLQMRRRNCLKSWLPRRKIRVTCFRLNLHRTITWFRTSWAAISRQKQEFSRSSSHHMKLQGTYSAYCQLVNNTNILKNKAARRRLRKRNRTWSKWRNSRSWLLVYIFPKTKIT